jgi:hypothetical protein
MTSAIAGASCDIRSNSQRGALPVWRGRVALPVSCGIREKYHGMRLSLSRLRLWTLSPIRVRWGISPTGSTRAPRVLIVMPEQWPRALLRAALREVGYDAVGTRTLSSALRIRREEPERGPVSLIVVDQLVLGRGGNGDLGRLFSTHGAPATILIARPTVAAPSGPWQRVLPRPISVADVVSAVETLLPIPSEARHPLDQK